MVEFDIINDARTWEGHLALEDDTSPYNLFGWGEYKAQRGWQVIRLLCRFEGESSCVQVCYKKKSLIFFGWIVGYPFGSLMNPFISSLVEYLKTTLRVKIVYLRANFTAPSDPEVSLALYSSGWVKSPVKMNSDYTLTADLSHGMAPLKSRFSSNWKRNLNRGIKKGVHVDVLSYNEMDTGRLAEVFSEFKKIKDVPLPSKNELDLMQKHLGDRIRIAVALVDGDIVSIRAYLYQGDRALDFWAATIGDGRRNYASHVVTFALLEDACEQGVKCYDFSGIDPVNNPGVFNFKNGMRVNLVEKLGEWEWCRQQWVRFAFNFVVRYL